MKNRFKSSFEIDRLIQRFIATWCALNFVTLVQSPIAFTDITYAFNINLGIFAAILLLGFVAFSALCFALPKAMTDTWIMVLSYSLFTATLLTLKRDFWFALSLIIITAIMLIFLLKDDKLGLCKIKIGNKLTAGIVAACAITLFALIAVMTCLRYATYSSPNFDFGLFVNMFHHMKETGLPITSSERDKLLSHFAVHISPIYYLLLPAYLFFPSPYTLQIGQALVLAGGMIPLYLLAKHKALSNKMIILLSIAYSFSPIIICGTSYDIHENCFLVPLLLWVFYFFEKEKYLLMYIATVFVFCIKEDACLFIFFFSLFVILSKKKYVHGIVLCCASLAYFIIAISILTTHGDGLLTAHYQNYMYEDNGLFGMIQIILTNPAYVFTQTLKVEKLPYLMYVLLPLGFLPFATRRVSHLILVLPFMLFNLMTSYIYQYNIDFQYTYGAISCMLYLAVINSAELEDRTKRYAFSLAAVASAMFFLVTAAPKIESYSKRIITGKEEFQILDEALESIPEDASVKASTFFVPHIADRHEIYEIKSENETDYVAFDMRPNLVGETVELRAEYFEKGYEIYNDIDGYILILKNPAAN